MIVTSVCITHPPSAGDVDNDVTCIPDNRSEEQPLLSDSHVTRRYSQDERLPRNDEGGRHGNVVMVRPDSDSTASQFDENITT